MKAKCLDKKFDENKEDILEHFESISEIKRINIDFPKDILNKLDALAKVRGVTRQSLLKVWIYEKVQQEISNNI